MQKKSRRNGQVPGARGLVISFRQLTFGRRTQQLLQKLVRCSDTGIHRPTNYLGKDQETTKYACILDVSER